MPKSPSIKKRKKPAFGKRRANVSKKDEIRVLTECGRICALCFGLFYDVKVKRGQIAHIDRDRTNSSFENAAWLCRKHADEYDTRSYQTKGFQPGELRHYQQQLIKFIAGLRFTGTIDADTVKKMHSSEPIGLDIYQARIPIYRTTVQFVLLVLKDLRPEMAAVLKFARDTDEALFLLDETIADHLNLLFKKALRLRTIDYLRNPPTIPEDFSTLVDEQTQLAVWFSEQIEVTRGKFAPFLRLS